MFLPEQWFSRMNTIGDYQSDASAMGRINAWWMAWNLASDRFFGGGFSIYDLNVFGRYAPDPTDVHAAHSIYFQVLGEHGFVGLFLFMTLWILVWWNAGKLRQEARKEPQTEWLSDLGAMCQVSLVGYAVGGAFLSLAYFDLPYNILIMIVVGRRWIKRRAWLEPRNWRHLSQRQKRCWQHEHSQDSLSACFLDGEPKTEHFDFPSRSSGNWTPYFQMNRMRADSTK